MTEPQPNQPKRRPRYTGTHPRTFAQKYKEKDPQRYPQLNQRLREKGKTPAGSHIPIMVAEILAALQPKAGEVIADCTLGYGGHARQFAPLLGPTGKILGFDVDGDELEKTKRRLADIEPELVVVRKNYAGIASILPQVGVAGVDIIFADIGVSSMQVDDPQRGISYKHTGPLDMRMDSRLALSGAEVLARLSAAELSSALKELADEPDHEAIAQAIVRQRQLHPIIQTNELMDLIFAAKHITLKKWKAQQQQKNNSLHPAARTFQALRILVNDELGALKQLLRVAATCLNPGGRLGIISFHSGEDRLVKNAFRADEAAGVYEFISPKPLTASREEMNQNPRSSAAKFRYARKALEK